MRGKRERVFSLLCPPCSTQFTRTTPLCFVTPCSRRRMTTAKTSRGGRAQERKSYRERVKRTTRRWKTCSSRGGGSNVPRMPRRVLESTRLYFLFFYFHRLWCKSRVGHACFLVFLFVAHTLAFGWAPGGEQCPPIDINAPGAGLVSLPY